MQSIAYVNGQYLPIDVAAVSILDRGYQFADSVYEVVLWEKYDWVDWDLHYKRLQRSVVELGIQKLPASQVLRVIAMHLLKVNKINTRAMLYLQFSRGAAARNHLIPKEINPTLVMTLTSLADKPVNQAVPVITLEEIRWARCDIKSTSLLANVLARQIAEEQGAAEALFYRLQDECISEGSSSNVFMFDRNDVLLTAPECREILGGVTRKRVISSALAMGLVVREQFFTRQMLYEAKEAFLTSSTKGILPISTVDGVSIGNGRPGVKSQELEQFYWDHIWEKQPL